MILREVLHAHIPYLTEQSTVRDAIDKMDVYQFPALVFVDTSLRPIGIITEGDIARTVSMRGDLLSLADEPALRYATRDPETVSGDVEVSEALHRMLSSGLTLLPVVDDDNLLGVVMRIDLMQAMLLDVD